MKKKEWIHPFNNSSTKIESGWMQPNRPCFKKWFKGRPKINNNFQLKKRILKHFEVSTVSSAKTSKCWPASPARLLQNNKQEQTRKNPNSLVPLKQPFSESSHRFPIPPHPFKTMINKRLARLFGKQKPEFHVISWRPSWIKRRGWEERISRSSQYGIRPVRWNPRRRIRRVPCT